jgi:hypothetical protein
MTRDGLRVVEKGGKYLAIEAKSGVGRSEQQLVRDALLENEGGLFWHGAGRTTL